MEEEQERPQPITANSVPHFTNEPQCLVLPNGAPPSTYKHNHSSNHRSRSNQNEVVYLSLQDKAKDWLHNLKPRTIRSFTELTDAFLLKFFPKTKTDALRQEIMQFSQEEYEPFFEAWERYQ
ncbi:hypothetical protein ACFX1Z_024515 [Malus domestica]